MQLLKGLKRVKMNWMFPLSCVVRYSAIGARAINPSTKLIKTPPGVLLVVKLLEHWLTLSG